MALLDRQGAVQDGTAIPCPIVLADMLEDDGAHSPHGLALEQALLLKKGLRYCRQILVQPIDLVVEILDRLGG